MRASGVAMNEPGTKIDLQRLDAAVKVLAPVDTEELVKDDASIGQPRACRWMRPAMIVRTKAVYGAGVIMSRRWWYDGGYPGLVLRHDEWPRSPP